jgi:DNA processing protein
VSTRNRTRAWLALILAPGLGPQRLATLDEELSSLADWPALSHEELRERGLTRPQIDALHRPDERALERALTWLEGPQHFLITRDDALYPPLLKQIADPPLALFVAGRPELLVHPQLAIVGSRNATPGGLDHARDFAATIARAGFGITSGLAAGVDSAAHSGCLEAGGLTLAVTGTGPDQIYPARNKALAHRIIEEGAMLTPFPPGTPPLPGNFPARNRIISGMSLGTLVVEAGLRSGSLITARLATEQGREVFALPGSVHNPQARGCHRLIRDGARLVETADEVIDELGPLAGDLARSLQSLLGDAAPDQLEKASSGTQIKLDGDYQALLEAVGFDPTPIDTIIRRSELTAAAVSSMLLMLELDGHVAAHPGARYSRTANSPLEKDEE